MKVKELVAELQKQNQELEVVYYDEYCYVPVIGTISSKLKSIDYGPKGSLKEDEEGIPHIVIESN